MVMLFSFSAELSNDFLSMNAKCITGADGNIKHISSCALEGLFI